MPEQTGHDSAAGPQDASSAYRNGMDTANQAADGNGHGGMSTQQRTSNATDSESAQ